MQVGLSLTIGEKIADFKQGIMHWFASNRRDFYWRYPQACTYTKILSEVLLQRTQAAAVSQFLPGFLLRYPDWETIAHSDEASVGQMLRPLGLWRRRASALISLSRDITSKEGKWPATRGELECMPAVGQYVASAVLIFVHGGAAPLMDASMARVLRRYFNITPLKADIRYDKPLQEIAHAVVDDTEAIAINWAILDFAAIQCKKSRPECESCPLQSGCAYYNAPCS